MMFDRGAVDGNLIATNTVGYDPAPPYRTDAAKAKAPMARRACRTARDPALLRPGLRHTVNERGAVLVQE
jgi:hypothetical protein